MKDLHSRTVREIALESPVSTRVFEAYHIDYCCGGRKSLDDACDEAGVSASEVEERLREILTGQPRSGPERFDRYSLDGLVDHILETHHDFTRAEIAALTPLMDKVAQRHGNNHEYLLELNDLVEELFAELLPHMEKEERILFPYMKGLDEGGVGAAGYYPPFGSVNAPISVMESEHERAGVILKSMRKVTGDYTLPEDACPSFTALFARLEGLEADLHQHIHLENNILFPKAVRQESQILQRAAG